ncbi:unnamed protein product [Coregonus sp. 'balchen']|nr:unnamed protein product [Coregonus sp. 'balchen']
MGGRTGGEGENGGKGGGRGEKSGAGGKGRGRGNEAGEERGGRDGGGGNGEDGGGEEGWKHREGKTGKKGRDGREGPGSSMGVELLRRMGWKDGQGVGPRVKRRLCKQEADPATRVFGSALPPNGSSESRDEEDDDEFVPENVTFAPKDVTPIDFTPKVDLHGLGYRGLNPLAALRGGPGAGNINLFTMDSDRTTNLFGEDKKGQRRRGGVAGQGPNDDVENHHRDTMSHYDVGVLGGGRRHAD